MVPVGKVGAFWKVLAEVSGWEPLPVTAPVGNVGAFWNVTPVRA